MKLIDKDVLVAEIEKRLDELWDLLPNASEVVKDNYTKDEANITGKYTALESFSKFLNTLEVKEVDLKQSYREYINNTYDEEFAKSILDGNIKGDLDNSDLFGIMSYGFGLGLKTQQNININITNIDKVIEENGVDPNSKEAKMFKESYYIALEKFKAQKGE